MSLTFEDEVTRDQVLLRGYLFGPTGAGKSRGALELAIRLAAIFGGIPVVLINTEPGRGKLYADRYKLDGYIEMADEGDYSPETYIRALNLAESRRPNGIYILDSVSHEWAGKNGILQQADRFGDWKVVRPKHNDWAERLQRVNGHLIVTVRAKMKYEVSEEQVGERKRQVVTPMGVGPIQSDDLQYDFNLVGQFEQQSHECRWTGHVDPLVDTTTNFAEDAEAAATVTALAGWLSTGNPPPPPPEAATDEAVAELIASLVSEGFDGDLIESRFAIARTQNRGVLGPEYVAKQLDESKKRIAKKAKTSESQARDEVSEPPDQPKLT